MEVAERLQPDLLILDLSMPVMSGIEVSKVLAERMPALRIIVTSQHSQPAYVDEALRAGVKGYVLKQASTEDVPVAIREVLGGGIFRSPGILVPSAQGRR